MTTTQTLMNHTIGQRARSLQSSAYALRQHAINAGADIEGWRLARRMRVTRRRCISSVRSSSTSDITCKEIRWIFQKSPD